MAVERSTNGRRFHVSPESGLGRWSLGSLMVWVVAFIVQMIAAASGQQGGDSLFDNLWLAIPGLVAAGGVTVSTFTGLVAMIGRHDRGVVTVLVTAVSTLVFIFVALTLIVGEP